MFTKIGKEKQFDNVKELTFPFPGGDIGRQFPVKDTVKEGQFDGMGVSLVERCSFAIRKRRDEYSTVQLPIVLKSTSIPHPPGP